MAPNIDPRAIPELSPQERRLQRILKGVVAVLTLLILVVLGVLVYKMITGGKNKAPKSEIAAKQTMVPAGASFGVREVALPKGGELIETTLESSTLLLQIEGEDGVDQVIVLDAMSGVERGRFVLKAVKN
ncbi:hypothetical protein [Govanella unica]|uniref:Fimbrial protein n=1 Tax=Govanella unica TaxID=2975056 RepID=A0A9X3Z6A5_9PROT|nr:hypothetical protein [Govania unica]MDA5193005.1 hypothetical protein [Govania unica]